MIIVQLLFIALLNVGILKPILETAECKDDNKSRERQQMMNSKCTAV